MYLHLQNQNMLLVVELRQTYSVVKQAQHELSIFRLIHDQFVRKPMAVC